MKFLSQSWTCIWLDVLSLPRRVGSAFVVITGIAAMTAVMISLLAIGAGAAQAAHNGVPPNRVIFLSAAAPSEYASSLTRGEIDRILQMTGLSHDPAGRVRAAPNVLIPVELTEKRTGAPADVPVRGTSERGPRMDAALRLVAGQPFRPGFDELIVGRAAQNQFGGLHLGARIVLRGVAWRIVGVFEDHGSLAEGGLMGDAETILHAFDRPGFQSVIADLDSADGLPRLRASLAQAPDLRVTVQGYRGFLMDQARPLASVMDFVAYLIGGIMALAATLGTAAIMGTVVEGRTRELTTLRAIGYRGSSVAVSIVVEAMLLACAGSLLGAGVASALFDGRLASQGGLTFHLTVGEAAIATALTWAAVVGLLGAAAPAARAARAPIARVLAAT